MRTLYNLIMEEQEVTAKLKTVRDQIAYLKEKVMTIRSIPVDCPSKVTDIESCEESISELRTEATSLTEQWNRCRHELADYIAQLSTDIIYPLGGE